MAKRRRLQQGNRTNGQLAVDWIGVERAARTQCEPELMTSDLSVRVNFACREEHGEQHLTESDSAKDLAQD